MAMQFKKATKQQSRLRLSIAGPSGAGKTFTSLKIASEMGGRIAFIDTERGSASKYSDQFEFDVIELDDFHPEKYIEAIHAAEKAGYDILIIDSTTHEWNGKNGILELHEAANQRKRNSFAAWADVTPIHQKFIDAILGCKCHVIATVRSKTEYVQDKDDRGKTEVRKVGMASVQRDGMDYEYDIMMEMNVDHVGVITKTRCAALDGKIYKKPGRELAEVLSAWLSDGAPAVEKPKPEPEPVQASGGPSYREQAYASMEYLWDLSGKSKAEWAKFKAEKLDKAADKALPEWIDFLTNGLIKALQEVVEKQIRELSAAGLSDVSIRDVISNTNQGVFEIEDLDVEGLARTRDRLANYLAEIRVESAA